MIFDGHIIFFAGRINKGSFPFYIQVTSFAITAANGAGPEQSGGTADIEKFILKFDFVYFCVLQYIGAGLLRKGASGITAP